MKTELLYEGKAKKVYLTDKVDEVIVSYKDDATAFNGLKKGSILGKGVINNRLSNHLMKKMAAEAGIPTHLVEELNDRETLVKRVQIVPLEVIVRNIAAGSMSKRLGLPEGQALLRPVLEFSYKNDELGDPLINDDHALAMGLCTEEELATIRELTKRVNAFLKKEFAAAGLTLVDFKIEFGRYQGQIVLADEISPDTCRLWDVQTHEKLDKDRFRRDLGGVEEAYIEVAKRVLGEL